MTVSTTVTDIAYVPNGSATVFPYPFKIFDKADLEVNLVNATTKVEELQKEGANYTVSGVGDETGGNVTMITAPVLATHEKLHIRRKLPRTQTLDLIEGGDLPSDNIEKRHDRAAMKIQELEEAIERALKFKITSDSKDITIPELVADQIFKINSTADGIVLVETTDLTPSSTTVSAFGKTLVDDADALEARQTLLIPRKNLMINGDLSIAQRGLIITAATSFNNNDDSYMLDRWNLLSDGNDIVDVSRIVDIDGDSRFAMKAVVQTINKKFAFVQYLEANDSIALRGKKLSVSFRAKTTAAKLINNIRAAIVAWDSTADVLTSDMISAWGAQGVNPTLIANWTFENTAIDFALSTSYQKFTIPNIDFDTAGANNLALIIWVDDTDAASGDELILKEIQVEQNKVVTEFEVLPFKTRLDICLRYFQKSFGLDVTPAQGVGAGAISAAGNNAVGQLQTYMRFTVPLRVDPTMVGYNPVSSNAKWRNLTDGTDHTGLINFQDESEFGVSLINSADDATADGDQCKAQATFDSEL